MAGLTSDTKLLLHLDGLDEATTTSDSSASNHTIVFNGTAQLDTAQYKFGISSLLLDGNSDYISIADSADFDVFALNSDYWTIDLWIRPTSIIGSKIIINQYASSSIQWLISQENANIRLLVLNSGTIISTAVAGTLSINTWYHIALCKVANEYGLYINGTQISYTQDNDTVNITGTLYFGAGDGGTTNFFGGWMDEIRIQKSNYFNASPNVGNTDTINVPFYSYDSRKPSSQSIIIV